MDSRLVALKLVLDALVVGDQPNTIADRRRLQKAVLLGQAAGVDLGYRYGWYIHGPYSPALASDYYALKREAAQANFGDYQLRDDYRQALVNLQPLLKVPDGVPLPQDRWLELLASLVYARQELRKNATQSVDFVCAQKPPLAKYIPVAQQRLSAANLI